MSEVLQILIIEDVPTDAELMEYELREAGIDFHARRVDTEEGLISELSRLSPDIVLSDYSLPSFNGVAALRMVHEHMPEVPFIFVSGALGEELAIDLLKKGATDYVLKNRLSRLPIAVSRALHEVREHNDRKQAEMTLLQTQNFLRKIATAVEQAAEGMMITDNEGKVEYVNPAFTRISGYGEDDIVGRHYSCLRSERHHDAFYDNIWSILHAGKVWTGRLERRRKDGSVYDAEETISPVKDPSSEDIVNYAFIQRDITERARLEEQLHQLQKMEAIGTLAGGIAHDFNNILASILGFAELAIDDLPHGTVDERHLKHIVDSSFRGRELVKQILAFSRKAEYVRSPISISPLVKEIMKLLRPSIPATIDINYRSNAGYDRVKANPAEIQQIIMNLCSNAAHAMQQHGGTLIISVLDADTVPTFPGRSAPAGYVELTVQDTGHGMKPDVMKRIFEPFFTTKEAGQGTGMGLAVVYGIVNDLDGGILVESDARKGSIFRVFLPKTVTGDISQVANTGKIPTGHEHILFIDDDEMLVEWGKAFLERLGYNVTGITDAERALQFLRKDPGLFDLVFMDQTMPKMTGLRLAEELLKIRSDIPIILCTGHSDTVSLEKAREAGISDFLMKPLSRQEAADAIRRALDAKV